MSVIKFNAGDFLQTKVVEADIYHCEISAIDGPKKSSSGKSFSYFVDFTIIEGPFTGKTRTVAFNTETSSPSLLGEMQFYPTASFLEIADCVELMEDGMEPRDFVLDTDELLRKPLDVAWGATIVDGRPINIINTFHKYGFADEKGTGPNF